MVEHRLKLGEFGNDRTRFFTVTDYLFAVGYVRIVYGDHGPYVEFTRDQIRASLRSKFGTKLPGYCYYEWLEPTDNSEIKVYAQKRTVHNLPNPPHGGYKGNRVEGYADYKVGMFYVDPYDLINYTPAQ